MSRIPPNATIEEYRFADDGQIPNNPHLPLLVYRGALDPGGDAAQACEALFARHGWTGAEERAHALARRPARGVRPHRQRPR